MIQVSAIVLIWGYVLTFLYLTARTARRSGKRVWLFSKGRERQALPAILFRAAFVLGCFLPLVSSWMAQGWAEEFTVPLKVSASLSVIGLVLMAIGAGIAVYAQWHMGNSWRIRAGDGMQGSIVSDGPFAYSRNPVFVGQIALFSGLAVVYPNIAQTTALLVIVVAAMRQVRVEERVLARDLGRGYVDYLQTVRRWL